MTVAICTFNRARSLQRTLTSLLDCRLRTPMGWELLLVDNASRDDTKAVADRFARELPLRYVFEREQGLSHARNRALSESRSDVVYFTDDDVEVTNSWLSAISSAAQRFTDADYFGGRILPRWSNGRPAWLKDDRLALLTGLVGRYDLGEGVRPYAADELLPYGASFGLRRRLFERLDPFRPDLGVCGGDSGRGEEAEYLMRARTLGAHGVYVGDALCYHWNQNSRFSIRRLYEFGFQKGIADVRIHGLKRPSFRTRELMYAARGVFQLLKGRGDRFRQCVINIGIQRGLQRARATFRTDGGDASDTELTSDAERSTTNRRTQ